MTYHLLAQIYDDAGFSNYSSFITPMLVTNMQQEGWMGRRVLDLGCGTGASTSFFVQNSMYTYAIDNNASMLKIADMRTQGMGFIELIHQDIQTANFPDDMDLVYCMGNVINELTSLKDLGIVLQKSFKCLQPQKRMIFDMLTLRGLGEYLGTKEQVIDVSDSAFLTVQSQFNFESMSLRQFFTVFQRVNDKHWVKGNSSLTLRAYPVGGVVALAEKVGFKIVHQWTLGFEEFDPANDTEGRVIIVLEKPA